ARRRCQPADDPAALRVGEEQVDVEDVSRGQECDVFAVRTVGRTEIQVAADALLAADERLAQRERAVLDDGVIHLAAGLLPVGEDLLRRNSCRALEGCFRTDAAGREEEPNDCVIAETPADVREERLAVTIREVIRIAIELTKV